MKTYIIPPIAHLELINLGDSAFCLTQLYVKYENYRKYFQQLKKEGWWITMDSGIGDYNPVTQDVLFEAMKDLLPSEVIPVDTLFNSIVTKLNLDNFISQMEKENLIDKVEIFGCPQGATKEEWIDCYMWMLDHPYVKTIGMSKLAIPKAWLNKIDDQGIMEARHEAVAFLLKEKLVTKPLHFLGGAYVKEFEYYKSLNNPLFRSTDSCFTVLAAYNNDSVANQFYQRTKTPKEYFDFSLTIEQIQLAKENISFLKKQIG